MSRPKDIPLEVQLAERRRAKYLDGTLARRHKDRKRFQQEHAMQSAHEPEPILKCRWYIRVMQVPRRLQETYAPDTFHTQAFESYALARDFAQEHLAGCFVWFLTGEERLRDSPGIRRRRMQIRSYAQHRNVCLLSSELDPDRWYVIVDQCALLTRPTGYKPLHFATKREANAMIRERFLVDDALAIKGDAFPEVFRLYTTQAPE